MPRDCDLFHVYLYAVRRPWDVGHAMATHDQDRTVERALDAPVSLQSLISQTAIVFQGLALFAVRWRVRPEIAEVAQLPTPARHMIHAIVQGLPSENQPTMAALKMPLP